MQVDSSFDSSAIEASLLDRKRAGEGHSSLMFKQLLLANFHGLSDYCVCYGKCI